MKQKFTLADVAASCACIRNECLFMRCANVYDVSNKAYVLKMFQSGGGSGESIKKLLLLEAGTRLHTTSFDRSASQQQQSPNQFALKLRKHLRNRRLTRVTQVGCDRVVDLQFGATDASYHLLLEVYGSGNLILTDASYTVLSLLRSHKDDKKGIYIMHRFFYPFEHTCKPYARCDKHHIVNSLLQRSERTSATSVLSKLLPYGGTYACSFVTQASRELDDNATEEEFAHRIADKVLVFECWLEQLSQVRCRTLNDHQSTAGTIDRHSSASSSGTTPPSGSIIYTGAPEGDVKHGMYEEFAPYELAQFANRFQEHYDRFTTAADEFFSRIEAQTKQAQRAQAEQSAMSKLDRVRTDVHRRVEGLKDEAVQEETAARLLEENLYEVGQAIDSVNALIASGLSWSDVSQVVRDEQRSGNQIAKLIYSMDLPKDKIKLHLTSAASDSGSSDDNDSNSNVDTENEIETRQKHESALVTVDLNLSAYANASKHFEARKIHEVKRGKTIAQTDVALKQAEQKAKRQLEVARNKPQVKAARKEHFFEKFRFFISSEGFLVLAGRDAQQNEMLVKRYLKCASNFLDWLGLPNAFGSCVEQINNMLAMCDICSDGDVYVHADVKGAASCVVKNRRGKEQPIPPLTLQQSGQFCICLSQAWNNNVVTSAWWVYPSQVSKTAPTGEYMDAGAFMVRGKKHFLPPTQLVLGYTFLFKYAPM